MEFTGERFIPGIGGEIEYEHLHRYALCLNAVKGKAVADSASGEGYGSATLASNAKTVIGIDIDDASIDYARQRYADISNVRFEQGDCRALDLPDQSIDIVVSFETIEHIDRPEAFLREIKRILRPNGFA